METHRGFGIVTYVLVIVGSYWTPLPDVHATRIGVVKWMRLTHTLNHLT